MLEAVKRALSLTTTAYDEELQELIDAALADLGLAGIDNSLISDPLVIQAVKTYCRANFKSPDDYDKLIESYSAQKGQLQIATGYTDWGDIDGDG